MPSFWKVFAASWVLLGLLTGLWAIATPIGAAPDEPAHLVKAGSVVRGEFIGDTTPQGQVVDVPRYVAYSYAQVCYAHDDTVTADCVGEVPGDAGELVASSTTAGLYNPLYYLLVGWPSLIFADSAGILAMRIISATLVSAFLGITIALISTWRRPLIPMLGAAVAVTPMVLFLGGTVNPNALEIVATMAGFVGVLTIVRAPQDHSARSAAIVLIAAVVAANMRGLSLLWLAIAMLSPLLLLSGERLRRLLTRKWVIVAVAGTATASLFAAIWLLSTNSLGAGFEASDPNLIAPGIGTPWYNGVFTTFLATFDYARGIVGYFGWLDTLAPGFVYAVWSLLAGILIVGGLVLLRGRRLILVAVQFGAVLILPPALQGYYITDGGIIWQGRYILPLFVCLVLAAAAMLGESFEINPSVAVRLSIGVLALWAAAQFSAFATTLRRYSVGFDDGWSAMLQPDWAPPGGVWPVLLGFFVTLLGMSFALFLALRRASSRSGSESPLPGRLLQDDSRA